MTGRRTFAVNLALAPIAWTPEAWQLRPFVNPHYLNSLWLGTVWNAVLAPTRLWHESLKFILAGRVKVGLLNGLLLFPFTTLTFLAWGVRGKLRAHSLPLEVASDAEFLDELMCALEIRSGRGELVRAARH